jgi:dUTP pyrophosphatase
MKINNTIIISNVMKLQIKKADDRAIIPTYANEGDSGFDLYAIAEVFLYPGQRALVSTGLIFNIPKGFEMQIRPRSGMAIKSGITVLNTPGTIDSSYLGIVGVILINHGKDIFKVQEGDRIAQGVIAAVCDQATFEVVDNIDKTTSRGSGGYGSTEEKYYYKGLDLRSSVQLPVRDGHFKA